MHDKNCFFNCKKFFNCIEGKEHEKVKCLEFEPKDGYEPEPIKAPKIDYSKMLGIQVDIEDE